MSTGFYKRRRGILEHLEAGTISLLNLAVHDYLNLKANLVIGGNSSLPAGVSKTSARAIHAMCPAQISEKAIQRSLAHLENIGWIKRWKVQGKHGNYPVLICRGAVHDASGNEYRVNGEETTDWRNPAYLRVGDLSVNRDRAVQLLSTDREERKKNREKLSAPDDPAPKPGASVIAPQSLPDWIPLDAWEAYLEFRKGKRTKATREAIDLLIRKLSVWRDGGQDVREILERSVMNGWTGIFPIQKEQANGCNGNAPISFDEARNQKTDAALRRVLEHYRKGPSTAREALPPTVGRIGDADLHPGTPRS